MRQQNKMEIKAAINIIVVPMNKSKINGENYLNIIVETQ